MVETLYILLGLVAGFAAGLLGVGGGLIIVPVLIVIFQLAGFESAVIVHMAVATSLATIIFTSLSSIYAHHFHYHAVRWDIVKILVPGIVAGAWLGSWLAEQMSASLLKTVFGLFELLVALQMFLNIRPHASRGLPGKYGQFAAGTITGTVSTIVGIGGGTLTVPFLVWCNVKMQQAVATSSACGLPIALAGTAGFIVLGLSDSRLPAQTWWYVYWPAWLSIVVGSMIAAPLGARLAHRLSAAKLKRVFALVLLLLAIKMLAG